MFGLPSTGAQNDLERAAETIRQMVCRFGMSEALGPLTYGQQRTMRFLDVKGGDFGDERNYSEDTARTIDQEVRSIVERQYARAREAKKVGSGRHRHALVGSGNADGGGPPSSALHAV